MKFIIQRTLRLIFIGLLFLSTGQAQGQLETKIDSILQSKYKSDTPGAVALVSKNGEIIYKKAFGKANLELEIPMATNNVFKIGSMTKQFTAISIIILQEQGKLNLDDEITTYIPDYPTQGQKITIHNLLTHTSGIKSYTSIKAFYERTKNDLSPIELINFFKNETPDFNSGSDYKYNNSGYFILGHIIELVSNQSYAEFIEDHIFQPLKMSSSYYGSFSKIISHRASGYSSKKQRFFNASYLSLTLPYAAGSLMSTVDDLLKWQQAIKNNTLISQESKNSVFTNHRLDDGASINYGYGWNIKSISDVTTYEHGGAIPGFKSMGVYIPSEDIYVVVLTNCDCNSPTKATRKIAETIISEFSIKN